MTQSFARNFHFLQDLFSVTQELFARLGENHLFAQPAKKATPDIAFQGFYRVTDGGLGKVKLSRSLRKAARLSRRINGERRTGAIALPRERAGQTR